MDILGDGLAKLPECALSCLEHTCQLSNSTCICQNAVESLHGDCMLKACTLTEALFGNNLVKRACNVAVRDRSLNLRVTVLVVGTLSACIIAVRVFFKQFCGSKRRLESDDWMILTSVPICAASVTLTATGLTTHGMGRDLWGLSQPDLKQFGLYFYIMQILYIVLMAQIKLTLCLFYLNIFSGTRLRCLLWGTVVFHLAFTVAFVVGVAMQCMPVSYQWDKFDFSNGPFVGGHCININAAGWANGAINVASDVWLLAIPLSQIRRLTLHWKKKVGVALMFLTGAIITIVSVLRLNSIGLYASTANPTWDLWEIVWWSVIEICAGLICTSLPAIRLLLVRMAPQVFGSDMIANRGPFRTPPLREPPSPLCSGHTLPSVIHRKDAESQIAMVTFDSHDSNHSEQSNGQNSRTGLMEGTQRETKG